MDLVDEGPGGGCDADQGEEDGKEAQDSFPEEGSVIGVKSGAGRAGHWKVEDCGRWLSIMWSGCLQNECDRERG